MDIESYIILAPIAGVIGLLFAMYLFAKVSKADPGNAKMVELSDAIHEGAMAFLNREYRSLAVFVVILVIVLGVFIDWGTSISFLVGALASATAGYIGMKIATKANTRTTQAARTGINEALVVAFSGGAVMGLSVVGLGLLGLGVLYLIYPDPEIINGYALGASS
ncbi:MAG: sodium/proton-translocating pyrophosphatase, partial [Candidatus Contubernalis sp.]|nr:sodium/proton-translocating pyrophosphatase [Candidatus Contubernalis sp.]